MGAPILMYISEVRAKGTNPIHEKIGDKNEKNIY